MEFGSPTQIVVNVVGVALWAAVVGAAVRKWRAKRPVSTGHLMAIFLSLSISGTYVPAGPVLWLAWTKARARLTATPGSRAA